MFVFGNPADTARMFLDALTRGDGPGLPDIHHSEMSEEELRNLNAYLYAAVAHAIRHSMGDDVVEVLTEWYDEAFEALAGVSESFRERVLDGSVIPPGGYGTRAKYLAFVKKASES